MSRVVKEFARKEYDEKSFMNGVLGRFELLHKIQSEVRGEISANYKKHKELLTLTQYIHKELESAKEYDAQTAMEKNWDELHNAAAATIEIEPGSTRNLKSVTNH